MHHPSIHPPTHPSISISNHLSLSLSLSLSTCLHKFGLGPLSDHFCAFQRRFAWQAQWILHPVKSESNVWFCSSFKHDGSVGRLTRLCTDAFRTAGEKQRTHESDMSGGQGADFLRGVAFWSISSSGLLR